MKYRLTPQRAQEIIDVMEKHGNYSRHGVGYVMYSTVINSRGLNTTIVSNRHMLPALKELGFRHPEAVSEIRIHFGDVPMLALNGHVVPKERWAFVYDECMQDLYGRTSND